MKSQKEIDLELFRISLGYYLIKSPECDLQWAVSLIRHSELSPDELRRIVFGLADFGDRRRYKKLISLCRMASYNCNSIRISS
jgi:hypothetical protein